MEWLLIVKMLGGLIADVIDNTGDYSTVVNRARAEGRKISLDELAGVAASRKPIVAEALAKLQAAAGR